MTRLLNAGARKDLCTLILLGLLFLSFGVRVYGLDFQSIWRDEADSLQFAGSHEFLQHMLATPGHNAPLYYFALAGWMKIAGEGIFSARFFSALWGTLAVVLVYAVGRRLMKRELALLGAGLAGLSPYLVWYSQEARTYAMLLAFSLLATLLFTRAVHKDRVGIWAAYLLSAGICLYLHVTALLLLGLHGGALAICMWRRRRTRNLAWLMVPIVILLMALPFLTWEIRLFLSPFQTGHRPVGTADILAGLLLGLTSGPSGHLSTWSVLPGLFLVLSAFASPIVMRGSRCEPGTKGSLSFLLAWLIIPVLGLAIISWQMPVFSERYLIFVAPAFYLLAAWGAMVIWRYWPAVVVTALAGVCAVSVAGLLVQGTQMIKPDIRSAAAYVESRTDSGDVVLFLIPHTEGAFRRVAAPRNGVRYAGAPYAGAVLTIDQLEPLMSQAIAGARRVWLVESEPDLWDPQALLPAWLAQHGRFIETTTFHLVTVQLYDMRD